MESEERETLTVAAAASRAANGVPSAEDVRRAARYIDSWKRSLLDLSGRNRLVHFNKGRSTGVRIERPGIEELYVRLVVQERGLNFPRPRGLSVDDLELDGVAGPEGVVARGDIETAPPVQSLEDLRVLYRKLDRLRRSTRTLYEEQGVHVLFLALGLLEWREAEHSQEPIQSPLVLVPVMLERTQDRYRLLPHEDDVEVNPALAYRLQRDFGVSLPTLDASGDESSEDGAFGRFLSEARDMAARRGWAVLEEAWLALFQFYKLPMYRDLEAPDVPQAAASHPIVRALCGLGQRQELEPIDMAKAEEAHEQPELFPALDADSSQLEVMEHVRQGRTLVVQGPPGTGKSQTIVNIIAQALREGKRVLFVSEKRAALEVVYQRLERVGLAGLCLDLHSNKASRKAVIDDLVASLERLQTWNGPIDRAAFDEYRRIRQQLNEYVSELHRPRDRKGRTAFRVYGAWARLRDVPLVDAPLPFERVLDLEPQQEDAVIELLDRIGRLGVWDVESSHPWKDCICPEDYIAIPESVASTCGRLQRAYEALCSVAEATRAFIGVQPATAEAVRRELAVLRRLAARPSVPVREAWLDATPADRTTLVEFAREVRGRVRRRRQALADLERAGVAPSSIEAAMVSTLHATLQDAERRGWLRRLLAQWKVARKVGRLLNRKVRPSDAVRIVLALQALHEVDQWVLANAEPLRERLGLPPLADRLDDSAEAVTDALEWAVQVVEAREGSIPDALRRAILEGDPAEVRARAQALEAEATQALDGLLAAAQDREIVTLFGQGVAGHTWEDWPLLTAQAVAARWVDEAGRLSDWLQHRRQMAEARRLGIDVFLAACRAAGVPGHRLADAFRRAYLKRWLVEAYQQSQALRSFQLQEWEELRRRFQELDRSLQQEAVKATIGMASARLPRPYPASEWTLLSREARKKRRHLPLRRLFPKIPTLLLAAKPCLMMSPLSVATYLPRQVFTFDLVIMDEASQLRPGDAIGALLRCKQAVIFGDRQQMPPTDFFQVQVEGDEDEPDAQDFESVLDIADAYFPGPMLKWHYRSRDERLIAFSNVRFYQGALVTFPAPRVDSVETGVHFVYVPDGAFGRGKSRTNPVEARRVAELVLEHLRKHPELSLGVITMSIEQRDAVEDALKRLLRQHPEVRSPAGEELFIKNLETVQGDERDVIIVSIGYGPSEPGGMPSLLFGPINRAGGERRLNVAITRARYRLIVVASMRPEQLAAVVGSSRWEGPKVLADYLAYAARGGMLTEVHGTGEPQSEFEEAVRDALVERGYQVDCQVGVSAYRIDLAVRDPDAPGRYIVGIECDGATYHSAKTARDRDRIRQSVLESKGWTILRVWSTDWFRDPQRVTDRLVEAIERVRKGQISSALGATESEEERARETPHAEETPHTERESDTGQETDAGQVDILEQGDDARGRTLDEPDATAPLLPPYRAFLGERPSSSAVGLLDEHPDVLTQVVQQIVEVEAPVHVDQVYDRLRELYGHQRMGRRMRESVDRVIARAARRGVIVRRGEFLWRPGQVGQPVVARGPGDAPRAPRRICPEEWEAAVVEVLGRLGATSREEVVRATVVALLGYSRLSSEVRGLAEQATESLIRKGLVTEYDGTLHLGQVTGDKTARPVSGWMQ